MSAATRVLQAYLSALKAKDLDAIGEMSTAHSLFELPFLKPNRLVGKAEIVKAHAEIFANLSAIEISLANTGDSDDHAIGEGQLCFTRNNGDSESMPTGIAAVVHNDELVRISLYCDARNIRLWTDKTIM